MLENYYEVRGWDRKTGIPTAMKLKELGLDFVDDQLRALREFS
jgi:aldehyde:ferredoxin oxidoreductase